MLTRDRNVVVQLEDGTEVGFRIDNWVLHQTQKRTGCKGVLEMFAKIGMDDGNMDIESFQILVAEAADEYNHFMKITAPKTSERQASEYIDGMGGMIMAMAKITKGLQHYLPKNTTPPQKEGVLISQ
jgi:hypothetical protein